MKNHKPSYIYHQITEEYALNCLALKGATINVKNSRSRKSIDLVIDPKEPQTKSENLNGAFGGIWTRDHYLTKVTPHRARLRRQIRVISQTKYDTK